jgi:glyoxylase-like metal-dependent hydrolase (beta-lactamase superfamily II)
MMASHLLLRLEGVEFVDKVPISDEQVVSLEDIASGVTGLRILFVNVFAVANSDGTWALVDSGLRFSAGRIRRWTEEQFGKGSRPAAIVLTHGHFDHVGALEDLAAEWDVPVYAHLLEVPYLTGRSQYPPPEPKVGGGLMAVMSPLYPRGPIDIGDRVMALPADESVPGMPGWRWVPTPGHSTGHVSLFRDDDGTLIVGDAFCTTKQESFLAVATQRPELHGPPAYYTPDWEAARESVQRLAALKPNSIAPGHGQALAGPDAAADLSYLAANFDRIARPDSGRYASDDEEAA